MKGATGHLMWAVAQQGELLTDADLYYMRQVQQHADLPAVGEATHKISEVPKAPYSDAACPVLSLITPDLRSSGRQDERRQSEDEHQTEDVLSWQPQQSLGHGRLRTGRSEGGSSDPDALVTYQPADRKSVV